MPLRGISIGVLLFNDKLRYRILHPRAEELFLLWDEKFGYERDNTDMNKVAIELRGITKRFGSVVANSNINLSVYNGEILSLLGENGSGFFAIHIHEGGSCEGEDFSGSKGHYDPEGEKHHGEF